MSIQPGFEHFIIYDVATGEPRWGGSGPAGTIASQNVPDGFAIRQTSAVAVQVNGEWDLAALRLDVWEMVKGWRSMAVNGGAPTPFGVVDSDDDSRANVSGAALAALIAKTTAQPFAMDWTMADNGVVTLDADEMIALGMAVAAHVNAAHERARVLRSEIEAASDVAALFLIDVTADWPGVPQNG